MDKNELEKYAIIGGGLATVALLALTYKNGQSSSSGGGGQIASSVPVLLRSISPQTVQLREIKAQTDIAQISAKTEALKILASFNLGIDTNAVGERVTKYVSDNELTGRKAESLAAVEGAKIVGETNRFVAEKMSWAQQQEAYYKYESTRQQEKSKRTSSVAGTVGSVISGFLKFL